MENEKKKISIEDASKYSLKHRFALGALVSLFLSFTILLCGPLTLYIEGINDLPFTFTAILWPVLIVFGSGLLVFTLLSSLPPKKIHKIICSLIFGVALGAYIQGTYANISFGKNGLNGTDIVWSDFTTYGLINTAIWIVCLALPFVLMFFVKKYFRTIIMALSACLILIQVITLATFVIQNSDALTKSTYEVSTNGIYDLSKDENTIVFILDSFDQNYLDEEFEKHPEYKDVFEGFTEYKNTVASGAFTVEGEPSMVTGQAYKKESTYADYIERVWSEDKAYKTLKENGVDNRIFMVSEFVSKSTADRIENVEDLQGAISSYEILTDTMYRYTMFAYSPFYAKRYFMINTADFEAVLPDTAYTDGDVKFYNYWKDNNGFTYKDDYNQALRIYALEGAHPPYTMTADCKRSDSKTSLSEQIAGCFNYLDQFFTNMKENGIYDKATIIVTADHGFATDLPDQPILLVKRSGETEGLKESNAPVSSFDFLPSIASSLGISDYSEYGSGRTYWDIKEDEQRERKFYYSIGSNNKARVDEYIIPEGVSSYDIDKAKLNQSFYLNDGVVDDYALGTELVFTNDATANVYCTEGFRHTTGWRTPMAGPISEMVIPIESIPNDCETLTAHIGIKKVDTEYPVTVLANDVEIYKGKVDGDKYVEDTWDLEIPRSAIGEDNKLTLQFKFPNISNDEMELDVEERTFTISVTSIMIDTK